MSGGLFLAELRKRKVIQVAAIYGAIAWGVTEVVVVVVEQLFLPPWVSTLAVLGFVVGFPVAMFLAWTFDVTAEGIQRTTISSRRGKASIVGSVMLLVVCTAGLFLLIRPSVPDRDQASGTTAIMPNSIAVLPFENASRDPDDTYLSEGFTDELRDQLGRVTGLRIAARSSSISARQQQTDARDMSARLGVAVLVEGSLRRRGNSLRISVQLIEGSSGLALWSETYDRGPQEFLVVQQTIAEQIVQRVLPDSEEIVATTATRNASANELMLLARHYEQEVREQPEVDMDTLLEAIRLYREATEADAESALAHSRLAGALLYLGDLNAAEAPIFRALSLDPELAEIQETLGKYYWARSLPGAGTAFRRAVELNPNSADALASYAYWDWMQGHNDGPDDLFRRALELDPLSLSRFADLGNFLAKDARVEEALDLARRVEELFDDPAAYRLIARIHELTGNIDHSIAWTIRARDLQPENTTHAESLAELYAELGDFDTALELEPEPGIGLLFKMRRYREVIDVGEFLMIEEPHDIYLRYLLGFAYNATGRYAAAVRILRSTGLPDTVIPEAKQAIDIEALVTLIDAIDGVGETELARELAGWFDARDHAENANWWINVYRACALAVLGRDAEALDRLERVAGSFRLPWESILRDSRCFKRYADQPRYQAVLRHADSRRAELRERLPATLAEFRVVL